MTPAVRIRKLTKRYGTTTALDNMNLEIPEGAVFGMVGRNGAGKTTSLMIMAGLIRADAGDIDILGKGPFKPETHGGDLTLLPQDAHLPGHATVYHTLEYLARLQGIPRASIKPVLDEVLTWVNLTDRAKDKVRTLSHGMLRRLTVAQAFLGEPRLVLLDEPTSGLDPEQVVQIRNLILSRRNRQTIIISSHILSEIEAACDTVAFIEKGRTIRQDTLNEITGRDRILTIHLAPGPLPLEALRTVLPQADIRCSPDNSLLSIVFNTGLTSHAQVNRAVLPILLDHGAGVLEIHSGTSLEKEFLNQL